MRKIRATLWSHILKCQEYEWFEILEMTISLDCTENFAQIILKMAEFS